MADSKKELTELEKYNENELKEVLIRLAKTLKENNTNSVTIELELKGEKEVIEIEFEMRARYK